jgi:hypothetical protein
VTVESARRFSHPPTQVFVENVRAYIDAYQGRFDEAIPVLERALRGAEVHGLSMITTVSSVLGAALVGQWRGRTSIANARRRSRAQVHRLGDRAPASAGASSGAGVGTIVERHAARERAS